MRSTKVWMGIVPAACAVLLTSAVVMGQSTGSMQADTTKGAATAKSSKGVAGTSAKKTDMNATKMTGDTLGNAADTGSWTCTMHPEVHKTESGKCPKCGMKLQSRDKNMDTTKTRSRDTTATKGADGNKMRM